MKPKKYQGGGGIDLSSLFGGTNPFGDLFPGNTYDFNIDATYDVTRQGNLLADEALKELRATGFDDQPRHRRKISKAGRKQAQKNADDPDFIKQWETSQREKAVGDYFKSDYFSEGMQGLMGQFQEFEKNRDSEKDAIEIDQYRVGPDQGFDMSFQKGGKVSKEGYRTGSPDIDEDSLTIKGNKISMTGVDKALLLIPDNGDPIYAQPNSGEHYFPGATAVQEYPIETIQAMQKGGGIDRISLASSAKNPKKGEKSLGTRPKLGLDAKYSKEERDFLVKLNAAEVKARGHHNILGEKISDFFDGMEKRRSYSAPQEQIEGTREYNRLLREGPAPALMQMGGRAEPIPVQLEKGEEVIFEDNKIVQPKAKKRHSQMGDYEYTDILPEGSYVASRDRSQLLDRDHAENMITSSMGPFNYDENEVTPIREEKNLGMMFRKKQETPAGVAKAIRTKIPVSDNKDDMYAEQTGLLNLETRIPYTNALIQMSEAQGKEMEGSEEYPDQKRYGGYTKMKDGGTLSYPVDKHQVGAAISAGSSIISGIISAIGAGKARKNIEQQRDLSIRDINAFENDSNARAGIGLGIGSMSVLGQFATQDTSYSNIDLDPIRTRTANAFNKAGQNIDLQNRLQDETQQAPLYTVAKAASKGDPRTGIQAYNAAYSEYLNKSNARGINQISMETDLTLGGAEALNTIDRAEILDKQQGEMFEKGARNVLNQGLFKGLGDQGQSFLQNRDRIQGATTSARMAARGQATSALNQVPFMLADGIDRIGQGVSQFVDANQSANQAGNTNWNQTSNRWDNAPPNFTTNTGVYSGWTWNPSSKMYEPD